MLTTRHSRRTFLGAAGGLAVAAACTPVRQPGMTTLVTLGDSILDSGRYNPYGLTPGQLLVTNDNGLFPEFRGRDLSSRGPARLEHRARDGVIVGSLPAQAQGLAIHGRAVALLTIGGNDLLRGLMVDQGPRIEAFSRALDEFLQRLPIRPALVGNVYDPTFGDDARNFLGVDPALARANHHRPVNASTRCWPTWAGGTGRWRICTPSS